jgi:mannose-6-phosphate isomerase-like protein (cupin superfamily)
MADYDIRTDVKYGPRERIDVAALAGAATPWFNQTLCRVNDSVVRLGVVEGEFHWHKHDSDDEFFYVTEGRLLVDLDDGETVELGPGQAYVVPAGTVHRTRAPVRTAILMTASAQVRPTGD